MRPIKILPLGMSGSGKSVYLAALYEKLSQKRKDTCFSMQTSYQFGLELAQTYTSIKNPSEPWPPGTIGSDYNDYAFDCVVSNQGGEEFCLMKLLYLDFPGGLLRGDGRDQRFLDRLEETDAFLIFLDGVQIFQALKGSNEAKDRLTDDLRMILNPLRAGVRKPVHFVVSKWDVLESEYPLGAVAALLRDVEAFSTFIEQRKFLGRGTRLIPVSAVGSKFAKLNSDGHMDKIERARAEPFNVDLPVSCLLFDLISEVKSNLMETRRQTFFQRLWYRILGQGALFLDLSKTVITYVPLPAGMAPIKAFLNAVVAQAGESTSNSRDQMKETLGASVVAASSAQQAFSELVKYQAMETFWSEYRA